MSKKSCESQDYGIHSQGFLEIFSSKGNVFSNKKDQLRENRQQHTESDYSSGSEWSSVHVPYAQVHGPQSSNLPPPHIFGERLQKQQQQQPQQQRQQWDNPYVPPSLFAGPDTMSEKRSVGLSPSWNGSASNRTLPLPPLNNSNQDGFNNNDRNAAAVASTIPSPNTTFHNKASRFNEFANELKYLLRDLIEYNKTKSWKKKFLAVVLCICFLLVCYDLLFGKQHYIVTWLHLFIVWMTTNPTNSVFAFVGIFVLSTQIFVPPTLLVFGAGYAFVMSMDTVIIGVLAACLSCFMGSCLGAIISFARSRYMMRDLIKIFTKRYPLMRAVDQALKINHGFRIMLLLRLCPVIPFNSLNYCCGITGVTLHDFTLSLVGILPFQIYTLSLGATSGAIELQNLKNDDPTRRQQLAFLGFLITGVLFGLVAIVYVYRLIKHELKKELGLSTEEFETMILHPTSTSNNLSPNGDDTTSSDGITKVAFSKHLNKDGNNSNMHTSRTAEDTDETTHNSLNYYQEGEEWFWIWA